MSQSWLKALKAEIPYHWKVQTAKSWGCECVAYIDARQVMDLLNEVVGPENWQDHYREVAGKIYCELSLRVDGEWVSKSDCGSASTFESEKGQASDAFKRTAVKWGIGRFLYTLDSVRLKSLEVGSDASGKPRYAPADERGRRIYNLTAYLHSLQNKGDNSATPTQKEDIKALCQKLSWSGEQLKAYLRRQNISWKALNRQQAAKVLVELEGMIPARQIAQNQTEVAV